MKETKYKFRELKNEETVKNRVRNTIVESN